MKTTVTRRTILGFAVNASPTQDNPGYHFELPNKPMWSGTIRTISTAMANDRFLNSLTTTYHSSAWFVKVGGVWMRVVDYREFSWMTDQLISRLDGRYLEDAVEVEVEKI